MNITKWLEVARKEADKSNLEYHLGCCIVKGNNLVGKGHNHFSSKQEKISKMYGCDYFSVHAEMDALLKCDDVSGCVMFVSGVKHNGGIIDCKPCSKCRKILKHIGIDVYYTTKSGIEKLEYN